MLLISSNRYATTFRLVLIIVAWLCAALMEHLCMWEGLAARRSGR